MSSKDADDELTQLCNDFVSIHALPSACARGRETVAG